MHWIDSYYAFMTSLGTSLLIIPFLCRWAFNRKELDWPDQRKRHDKAIPRIGGIAIFLSFLFTSIIFIPPVIEFRAFWAGSLVAFLTGLADDLNTINSKQKVLGLIFACLVTIFIGDLWIHNLGDLLGFGQILLPDWAGIPFTIFAVVGISNAINLIDGLDGLAGGISLLSLAAFILLGLIDGNQVAVLLSIGLAGSILGFLKYNFFPARIFMGDSGSLSIGFMLGFLAVILTQRPGAHVSPMLPVLILGLPIFDTLWVIWRRIRKRKNPFVADRSHVHYKFLDLGFEHRLTVLIIYAVSLFWAISALLLINSPEYLTLSFLLASALILYWFFRHVSIHPETFQLIQRDSNLSLRKSILFQRTAESVGSLMPFLGFLLLAYALLTAGCILDDSSSLLPVILLLFLVGLSMRILTREAGEFQMLLVYAVVILSSLIVGQQRAPFWGWLSVQHIGDALLCAGAFIALLKFFFRRKGELVLTSPDHLTISLMVLLIIFVNQWQDVGNEVAGVLVRSSLLILIARVFADHGMLTRRRVINASLVLLIMLITLNGSKVFF